MEVEMKIRGLMMDPVTNMPIVVLKDVARPGDPADWVGVYEGGIHHQATDLHLHFHRGLPELGDVLTHQTVLESFP